jgi:hypothetical protein
MADCFCDVSQCNLNGNVADLASFVERSVSQYNESVLVSILNHIFVCCSAKCLGFTFLTCLS